MSAYYTQDRECELFIQSLLFYVVQKCSLYLIPFFSLISYMIIYNSSTYRLPKIGMCLCF